MRMQTKLPGRRASSSGFSLIELLIVVGVIAILAAIAYPNYRDYVVNSRRAAAAACLQEHAQFLERYYTTNLTYVSAPAPAACDDLGDFYTFGFSGTGTPAARTFEIQAQPTARQPDTRCGTLTLNAQGQRGRSGSAPVADCW